jgi:hypothetical protein
MQATNGSTNMFMSFALGGANTQAASDSRSLILLGKLAAVHRIVRPQRTERGKHHFHRPVQGEPQRHGTFSNRSMFVIPLS